MQTVSITAQDDGTFTVGDDAAGAMELDMPMDMPDGESMPAGETFATLDEALDAARTMLGGDAGVTNPALMEGEADFLAGFKGANGSQEA